MEQNTQEWLEMRKKMIGSSDAPIIMEMSPFKTPLKLWEEKVGISKSNFNPAMAYGHKMEPIARRLFEEEMLCTVEPKVILHPNYDWMMASLDGLNVDAKIAVEIKNPNAKDHNEAKLGKVPDKYYAQLQHQLEVLFALYGIDHIYYFSHHKGDVANIDVKIDTAFIEKMFIKELDFIACVRNNMPPESSPLDVLENTSQEWEELANEWIELNSELEYLVKKEIRS